MSKNTIKWLALIGGATIAASAAAYAQDSGALLDALVKKGILNDQEAEEIRADLTSDFHATPWAIAGGKNTKSLKISGRIQGQFDALSTDTDGAGATVAANQHFFLRRVRLGAEANISSDWKAFINYDFASTSFDAAYAKFDTDFFGEDLSLTFGLRKPNFGYEETTSSGSLKSIERSGVTRYFVESNNTRRLGAGKYRIGVFADFNGNARKGKESGLFYGAAITNPEQVGGTGNGIGNATNNNFAYWADAGYTGLFENGSYKTGLALGYLPDQGAVIGGGDDITEASLYADVTFGAFNLAAEYLTAKVENAAGDNDVVGYWIQPSYKVTDKFELVARYSHLDTDGRGVRVSDGIRNSNSVGGAGTANELTEYYLGFNYYIAGSDVKFSLGCVGGETDGALREEEVSGVRSQLQINF
ncbi:MAG: porin [Verrucomicrobiota bacterium]